MKNRVSRFTAEETANFCSQIAMLLNGGISLFEGIEMFYEEADNSATKETMKKVSDELRDGSSLSDALRNTNAFPEYMVQMTEVGEKTGKLEDVMNGIAAYYERESAVNSGIKNVIMYPVMLFSMMAIILIALVTRILPMFEAVFYELDNKTPGAETMMGTSLTVSRVTAAIVFVILIVLLSVLLAYRIKNGADELGKLINRLPFASNLSEKLGKDRFLAALSIMVGSGMETEEAVERASELPNDMNASEMARQAVDLIRAREPLDDALLKSGILSTLESRMLGVGMKTGSADQVLDKLSTRHDEEIGNRLNSLSAKIEVGLVVILTVLVGVILLMVMMPLISVIASI